MIPVTIKSLFAAVMIGFLYTTPSMAQTKGDSTGNLFLDTLIMLPSPGLLVHRYGGRKLMSVPYLFVSLKNMPGIFDNQRKQYVFGKEGSIKRDIIGQEAREMTSLYVPKGAEKTANRMIMEAADSEKPFLYGSANGLSPKIESVVFRKDSMGDLTLALVTEADAETYALSIFMPMDPHALPEEVIRIVSQGSHAVLDYGPLKPANWAYNSSTDITLSQGASGEIVARGRMEYLCRNNPNACVPNFGDGTRVAVSDPEMNIKFVNGDGSTLDMTGKAAFAYSKGRWKKE